MNEAVDLDQKALTWKGKADVLIVQDQASYDAASEMLKVVKALQQEAESLLRPTINKAFATHKEACAALKKINDPLAAAEGELKAKLGIFLEAENQKRRQFQMEVEAEARRRQAEIDEQVAEDQRQERAARETAILQEAYARQGSGADAQELEAVLAQADEPVYVPVPLPVAVPVVAPTIRTTSAASPMYNYSCTVVDFKALIKAAAAPDSPWSMYVVANESALNALARNQKDAFKVPGCRLNKVPTVRSRS